MKPEELKRKYIELRAEGNSYASICEKLNICKATCTSWERELKEQIEDIKKLNLQELAESYSMTKEARIKKLGSTLDKINTALENVDFSQISPEKLLDYKLKYTEALKGEYIGLQPAFKIEAHTAESILEAYTDLLNRVRAGEVSKEQADKENNILTGLLRAYEQTELKQKLEQLEAVINERGSYRA